VVSLMQRRQSSDGATEAEAEASSDAVSYSSDSCADEDRGEWSEPSTSQRSSRRANGTAHVAALRQTCTGDGGPKQLASDRDSGVDSSRRRSRRAVSSLPLIATESSGPGADQCEDKYLCTEDLLPVNDPVAELNRHILGLETGQWPEVVDHLIGARRLSLHHHNVIVQSESTRNLMGGVMKHTNNLRSVVVKNALLAMADVFRGVGPYMDHDLTDVTADLIKVGKTFYFNLLSIRVYESWRRS